MLTQLKTQENKNIKLHKSDLKASKVTKRLNKNSKTFNLIN